MTDDEKRELANRAVDCDGWEWMPGMLTLPCQGGHVQRFRWLEYGWHLVSGNVSDAAQLLRKIDGSLDFGALPDFSDPATLGCLLELVRRAHKSVLMPHGTPEQMVWMLELAGKS